MAAPRESSAAHQGAADEPKVPKVVVAVSDLPVNQIAEFGGNEQYHDQQMSSFHS
jgi:hypothetical protein